MDARGSPHAGRRTAPLAMGAGPPVRRPPGERLRAGTSATASGGGSATDA